MCLQDVNIIMMNNRLQVLQISCERAIAYIERVREEIRVKKLDCKEDCARLYMCACLWCMRSRISYYRNNKLPT